MGLQQPFARMDYMHVVHEKAVPYARSIVKAVVNCYRTSLTFLHQPTFTGTSSKGRKTSHMQQILSKAQDKTRSRDEADYSTACSTVIPGL